jgi:YtoQ family protein
MRSRRVAVYLAGEIHTDWRSEIVSLVADQQLNVHLVAPILDHDASDGCGEPLLGPAPEPWLRDHIGAGVNGIRATTLIKNVDVVVARFARDHDGYPDWTSAYEAGRAVVLGKPLITLHDESLDHPLKEVDRAALAITRTADQLVGVLAYAFTDGAIPALELSGSEARP